MLHNQNIQARGIFLGKKKYKLILTPFFFEIILFSYKKDKIIQIENIHWIGSDESRLSYKCRKPLGDDRAKQLRYTINLEYFAYLLNQFL